MILTVTGGGLSRRAVTNASSKRSSSTAQPSCAKPGPVPAGALGSILAQARWSPGEVVLATPRGESTFADLDALTRQALGESVPVSALFDWLQGRPWPGAPSAPAGNGPGFAQLGWAVELDRFDEAMVTARRDSPPPVTVRIKLDRR